MKYLFDHIKQPETIGFGFLRFKNIKLPLGKDKGNLFPHEIKQIDFLKKNGSQLDEDTVLVDIVNTKTGQTLFQFYTYQYDDGAMFHGETSELAAYTRNGFFDLVNQPKTTAEMIECYKINHDIFFANIEACPSMNLITAADHEQYLDELLTEKEIDLTQSKVFKDYIKEYNKTDFRYKDQDGSTTVNISKKKLSKIPDTVFQQNDIEKLLFYNNELEELPVDIGKMANLKTLNLSSNNLKTLPKEIGKLENLETLLLLFNPIESFPPEIGNLKKLKELTISCARLKELPVEIGEMTNIKVLGLHQNELKTLPKEIGKLQNLETLYISSNPIESLPPEIGNLKKLNHLVISTSKLKEIPKEVAHLENLESIECDEPIQDHLFPKLKQIPNLKSVFVGGSSKTQLRK